MKKGTIMKLKYLLAAVLAAFAAVAASAQTNLQKAIDDFVSDQSLADCIKTTNSVEGADDGQDNASYYYRYDFALPKSKAKKLNALRQAFTKDMPAAYNVMSRNAGISSEEMIRTAYGKELDKTVSFGTHLTHNYMVMLVRDDGSPLRRDVYALTWYDGSKKGSVSGSIIKISSLDPQKKRTSRSWSSSYSSSDDSDVTNVNLGSFSELASVRSSMDFLQQFGSLRAAYKTSVKEQNDLDIQTGIVNRILALCKRYGNLLSKSEKTVCAEGLDDLSKISTDHYLAALLDEASVVIMKK